MNPPPRDLTKPIIYLAQWKPDWDVWRGRFIKDYGRLPTQPELENYIRSMCVRF